MGGGLARNAVGPREPLPPDTHAAPGRHRRASGRGDVTRRDVTRTRSVGGDAAARPPIACRLHADRTRARSRRAHDFCAFDAPARAIDSPHRTPDPRAITRDGTRTRRARTGARGRAWRACRARRRIETRAAQSNHIDIRQIEARLDFRREAQRLKRAEARAYAGGPRRAHRRCRRARPAAVHDRPLRLPARRPHPACRRC